MATGYRVKVEQGTSQKDSFDLSTDALVIGADPQAVNVLIEGPGVEGRHAQLVFDGGQVKLQDLSEKSGTFRNGQRLIGPVQVFPGDRIGLGPEVVLILEGDDPKAAQTEGGLVDSVNQALEDLLGRPGDDPAPDAPASGKAG